MIVRREKTKNFTTICNLCFQDKTMSARAKGIYAYIMTLPNDWKLNKSYLYKCFSEGQKAIDAAFKELENKGYITKAQKKDDSGKYIGFEYIVYEMPDNQNRTTENGNAENGNAEKEVLLNTNRQNTNILNTNSTNLIDEASIEKSLPNQIISIINALNEKGKFNCKFDLSKQPTKTVRKVESYLNKIKAGTFTGLSFDTDWFKRHGRPLTAFQTWKEVKDLVLQSIGHYRAEYDIIRQNGSSLWWPKSIDLFFYSAVPGKPGKSMFLKYIDKTDTITEWQKMRVPDNVRNVLNPVAQALTEGERLHFWSTISSLNSWYEKNLDRLVKYNLAYNDNSFSICQSPYTFFDKVLNYIKDQNLYIARPISLDFNSSYWQRFRDWMKSAYNITLEVTDEKLECADRVLARKKLIRETERINDEVAAIEARCRAEGIDVPPVAELVEIAKKNIAEDDDNRL